MKPIYIKSSDSFYKYLDKNHIDHEAFNQPVVILPGCDCESLFEEFYTFNQPIEIPDGVENCCNMFNSCYSFNQPINMPDSVIKCDDMFYSCYNFNKPIKLSKNILNADNMFCLCYSFNQNIILPDSITNASNMFCNCSVFNQKINIPKNIEYANSMFSGCNEFNQPIDLSNNNNLKVANYMFSNSYHFNQPVIFSENNKMISTLYMFTGCENLHQDFKIYNSNCRGMFNNCNNMTAENVMYYNIKNNIEASLEDRNDNLDIFTVLSDYLIKFKINDKYFSPDQVKQIKFYDYDKFQYDTESNTLSLVSKMTNPRFVRMCLNLI